MDRIHARIRMGKKYFTCFCIIGLVVLFLAARYVIIINRYTVNVLFQDHWGTYRAFADDLPWLQKIGYIFSYQNGVHRMGIAHIFTYMIALLSSWNIKADAFLNLTVLVLSMLLFLRIKAKYISPLVATDAIIPLLFLSLRHYEMLVILPLLSYSIFPLLLLGIFVYMWGFVSPHKYFGLSVLTVVGLYTGYGLFLIPITIVLVLWDLWHTRQSKKKKYIITILFLLFVIVLAILFFHAYEFTTGTSCTIVSSTGLETIISYIGIMISFFIVGTRVSLHPLYWALGIFFFLIFVGVCLYSIRIMITNNGAKQDTFRIIVILLTFSLLFIISSAVGRSCLGVLQVINSPRYALFLVPGFCGLYFFLIKASGSLIVQILRFITCLSCAIFVFSEITDNGKILQLLAVSQGDKSTWVTCYRKHEDWRICDDLTHSFVYDPMDETNFSIMTTYMKERRLNLYNK